MLVMSLGSNSVDYLVVAGGGAGGTGSIGGGGGGGGFREGTSGGYTASPLASPAGVPVTATAYPIVVGGGGTKGTSGPEDNTWNWNGTSGIASSGFRTYISWWWRVVLVQLHLIPSGPGQIVVVQVGETIQDITADEFRKYTSCCSTTR
jgi:hypothetical protein